MNIFTLDKDPEKCSRYHCDKHIVKMVVEYTQLLSGAVRVCGYDGEDVYKLTHINHPCALWTRSSRSNFNNLVDLTNCMFIEYTNRYKRLHASMIVFNRCADLSDYIPAGKATARPKCVPDYCKEKSVVQSYRNYYIYEKAHFAKWKHSKIPRWFLDNVELVL